MELSTSTSPRRLKRQFWLVAGCFLVSGFAALLYETVWLRQFAILLGTSEQALAVVLASYMGGLAVGSLVASRVVNAIRRPLLTYGLLELGIALAALFVPVGLAIAAMLQSSIFGGQSEPPPAGRISQVIFSFATAFSLILIPTGLMGATLPLLARHVVSRDEEVGPRIGSLYAINTAGAVMGTLVAAFVCLPTLGLGKTVWLGATCNLLVFVLVLLIVRGDTDVREITVTGETDEINSAAPVAAAKEASKRSRKRKRKNDAAARSTPAKTAQPVTPRYRAILLFAAISGGVSFCYEIIFTRMLGHMLGGSVFAFATMLAGFLLGIALGGAIAARIARDRMSAAVGFVYAQSAAAVMTLVAYQMIDRMCGWTWDSWGGMSGLPAQVSVSMLALLPTATCVGATFPFAIRAYVKDETEAATGAARVYGWNVVGAIIGAMMTGFVLLPWLQYHHATAFAVLCNILIALSVIWVIRLRPVHAIAAVAALVCLVWGLPKPPENVIRVSSLARTLAPGDVIYNHVGKSATVTVFYETGRLRFLTNGLPESTVLLRGSGGIHLRSAFFLSGLPPLMRPQSESMLIIGLGGGVAACSVPPSIQSIDVIELEPAVVEANQQIAQMRYRDPLSDPRVKIILNDGRNALALTVKRYDTIVSQPSHPWTAGASHLYTREFNTLIRDHLNPGGVFLQWMDAGFVDQSLLSSMAATLLDVFPYVRMYQPLSGTFMFVASDQPMTPESVAASDQGNTLVEMPEANRGHYQRLGIVTPTHLMSMLDLDETSIRKISENAELITDERNLLAMRAPKLLKVYDESLSKVFVDQHSPQSRGLNALKRLCPSLDTRVYAQSKVRREQAESVQQYVLPEISDPAEAVVIENELIRVTQSSANWMESLKSAAEKYPDNSLLAYQLLSNAMLTGRIKFDRRQQEELKQSLTDTQLAVIDLIEATKKNELDKLKAAERQLAAIPVDDVTFEIAVRLRIPWRLEASGNDRVRRGAEVVQLIDDAAPFANSTGLAWFRLAGGINARQPLVALATATAMARAVEESFDDKKKPLDPAALSNLRRICATLRDPTPFSTVPAFRYQEVMRLVENVLTRAASGQ